MRFGVFNGGGRLVRVLWSLERRGGNTAPGIKVLMEVREG